jgi:hypothetical protein
MSTASERPIRFSVYGSLEWVKKKPLYIRAGPYRRDGMPADFEEKGRSEPRVALEATDRPLDCGSSARSLLNHSETL